MKPIYTAFRKGEMYMQAFLITFIFVFSASDFSELQQDYGRAKMEADRSRGGDRTAVIQKKVVPVLEKIAALETNEAVFFLGGIVTKERSDLAGAACGPLAATGAPEAVDLLLKAASTRPPEVRVDAMKALKQHKTTLSETQLLKVRQLAGGRGFENVQKEAVGVLGAQNSLPAARALVELLGSRSLGSEVAEVIEKALAGFTDKEALSYLFTDALGGEAKAPRQLIALLHAAAEKKAKQAQKAASALVNHPSAEVAGAAVSTLAALGFQGGREQIFTLLKKWSRNLEPAFDLLMGLADSGSPEAAGILIAVSREFDGPIRSAAVSLLGRIKTDASLTRVLEALEEKSESVKTAALRALQQYKDKRIIGPLIRFMGRETGRLQGEAYQHLVKITGKNMGLRVDDWRKWWDFAKGSFTFKPAKKGKTSVKAVDYYGIEIFSKKICFIIDRSSSMLSKARDHETNQESNRINLAKKELIKTLKKLRPGTMINIISFDANYRPMAKALTPLNRAGRFKAIQHVQNIKTGHGTNIYDTLSAALRDRRVNTIFLLSDGQPSRGKYTNTSRILEEIRKQNLARNVTINTIAIGDEKLEFMKDLAKQNGGTYIFVKD